LDCPNNQITNLDLSNCNNLWRLTCSNNKLTNLNFLNNLVNPERLTELIIYNNKITSDLTLLSKFVNLEELYLGNNNFTGSLQPLTRLVELKELDISDTDINSGLEYLPDSLEKFYCSASYRKNSKCQNVYNLFANDQGEVETELDGKIKNFPPKLQNYKQ
jgi:Leucine-rich repeat (LRR) protein